MCFVYKLDRMFVVDAISAFAEHHEASDFRANYSHSIGWNTRKYTELDKTHILRCGMDNKSNKYENTLYRITFECSQCRITWQITSRIERKSDKCPHCTQNIAQFTVSRNESRFRRRIQAIEATLRRSSWFGCSESEADIQIVYLQDFKWLCFSFDCLYDTILVFR